MKALPVVAAAAFLAAALLASAPGPAAAVAPTAPSPLRVSLVASTHAIDRPLGVVGLAVTNTSRRYVRLPHWQLPGALHESDLFRISRDGRPVDYTGRLVKRGLPRARDFIVIPPGRTLRYTVDLSAGYDLADGGEYMVTFAAPLQHASLSGRLMLKQPGGAPLLMRSAPIRLHVQRLPGLLQPQRGLLAASIASSNAPATQTCDLRCIGEDGCPPAPATAPVQATYRGCSASQVDLLKQAITEARRYSEAAKGYLDSGAQGTRYTWWFGVHDAGRRDTARAHFAKIDQALDQNAGQITIDCGCTSPNYAYVYPNRPYEIWVCNAFWSAPLTGTDSKAGTLVHEMSHFDVVANTDDHVYGQSGAHNLALTSPNQASGNDFVTPRVDGNADSHEYFAENTPTLQ
jgi:peptidyl-Lys metalloendopeptidase